MFEESIREGKGAPDFTGTDDYQVAVTLQGKVQDAQFLLRFMEQVGRERLSTFTTQDFLVLDLIHGERRIPEGLRSRLLVLAEQGIVEHTGHGRYILSRRFYGFLGKKGIYTRKRGLDRETNKALLLKHVRDNQKEGSQLQELLQVLPTLSRPQVQTLLRELKSAGLVHHTERTRAARWYPGPTTDEKIRIKTQKECRKDAMIMQYRFALAYYCSFFFLFGLIDIVVIDAILKELDCRAMNKPSLKYVPPLGVTTK